MSRRDEVTHSISLSGGIPAEVTYKSVRNLRIRILPPDGAVRVTAPHGTAPATLRRFLLRQHGWVTHHRALVMQRSVQPEPLVDGGRVRVWGHWHPVRVTPGAPAGAALSDGEVHLRVPGTAVEDAGSVLDMLYRRELEPEVRRYLEEFQPAVGRTASRFRMRRMTSRWGSCNHRTGSMTFNLALAEREPRYLEYVVVHEMVHLLVAGHGPDFHRHMDALLPDWRVRRRELRSGA